MRVSFCCCILNFSPTDDTLIDPSLYVQHWTFFLFFFSCVDGCRAFRGSRWMGICPLKRWNSAKRWGSDWKSVTIPLVSYRDVVVPVFHRWPGTALDRDLVVLEVIHNIHRLDRWPVRHQQWQHHQADWDWRPSVPLFHRPPLQLLWRRHLRLASVHRLFTVEDKVMAHHRHLVNWVPFKDHCQIHLVVNWSRRRRPIVARHLITVCVRYSAPPASRQVPKEEVQVHLVAELDRCSITPPLSTNIQDRQPVRLLSLLKNLSSNRSCWLALLPQRAPHPSTLQSFPLLSSSNWQR